MYRFLRQIFLCFIAVFSLQRCTYPDQAKERTNAIRDSIWTSDSIKISQFIDHHMQMEDSLKQLRDSLLNVYNDSVRRVFDEQRNP